MTTPGYIADTIVAEVTPPGVGGVSIVRVSGPLVEHCIAVLCKKKLPPRQACISDFTDLSGRVLDSGLVLYFPAPNSFTGESMVEFQGHGGWVSVSRTIRALKELGARQAEPGEFSKRAFLNDKIDLAQAEAIADMIHAQSEQAAQSAMRSLSGQFSKVVDNLSQDVMSLRVMIEANVDFADEDDVESLSDKAVLKKAQEIRAGVEELLKQTEVGLKLNIGVSIAICGEPNAGKSSLLNALSGDDAAIVTEIAGTTRDVIKSPVTIGGFPCVFNDTAGLRDTECPVEKLGISKSIETMKQGDITLWLHDESERAFDLTQLPMSVLAEQDKLIVVLNKQDLTAKQPGKVKASEHVSIVRVSAQSHTGLDELSREVLEKIGVQSSQETRWVARQRHVDAVRGALGCLDNAIELMARGSQIELMAEEIKVAHQFLGEITGRVDVEHLLGEIFSSFCIGK